VVVLVEGLGVATQVRIKWIQSSRDFNLMSLRCDPRLALQIATTEELPLQPYVWLETMFAYSCQLFDAGEVLPWLPQAVSRCRQPFSCT